MSVKEKVEVVEDSLSYCGGLSMSDLEDGLYVCEVDLKHTTHLVMKYSGGYWGHYMAPSIVGGAEGWAVVNFDFRPVYKIDKKDE